MRRFIGCYCIILIVTAITGLFLESRQEYAQERILWNIKNDFRKINNPASIENEFIVKRILDRYQNFLRHYPKSELIPRAKLLLAKTLISQDNYSEARAILEEITENYKYNVEIVAQALYGIAQSQESENNWPKAVTIYRSIIREYPLTTTGFSIPYYLGNFYRSRGLNSTALSAFNEAAEFYQNIAENYPDSPLGFTALKMAVKCQLAQGHWTDAFFGSRQIFLQYPVAVSLLETIQMIRDISIKKLNNPGLAISTYNDFLNRNPGHPINDTLKKIINNLQPQNNKPSNQNK
jgi:tetratricopeptide (TPR) repeat protein